MSARTSSEGGYTLIELLVAMLLLCFIGVALAGGLHFGTRVWESSDERIASTRQILIAQSLAREFLTAAVPRQKGGFVIFDGEQNRMTFVAPPPQAFPDSGLSEIAISVEPVVHGTQLVLRVTSLIDSKLTREAVLASHLGALHFSYLDSSEKIATWVSLWRDRKRLPDAIRIEEDGDATTWPPLIVRPEIAQDALCIFDPISMTCRES